MEFKSKNFSIDKPHQYEEVQRVISRSFPEKKAGYKHALEKIKTSNSSVSK